MIAESRAATVSVDVRKKRAAVFMRERGKRKLMD
jgi:hypothetical protein